MAHRAPSGTIVLEPADIKRVWQMLDHLTELQAVEWLQVSRQTLGRSMASLPVLRSTVTQIRERLEVWESLR